MDMIRKVDAFNPKYFDENKVFLVKEWNLDSRAKVKKPTGEYVGIVSKVTNDAIHIVYADQLNKTQIVPISYILTGQVTITPMKAVEVE